MSLSETSSATCQICAIAATVLLIVDSSNTDNGNDNEEIETTD